MDALRASNVSKIVDEFYNDLANIYEAVVDEDANGSVLIDQLIVKLKAFKSNLFIRDEV